VVFKKYCKWLIDVVGKDGGLVVGPGSVIDEVKPENLKAMLRIGSIGCCFGLKSSYPASGVPSPSLHLTADKK
jgi:hypothetical protein